MRRWLGTGIIGIILSWLSSVWDTYIRYLAGYRPIITGTPGASNFRLISLANTETLLSPSFMLVKYGSIWELHLFTIRQSLIQSLHLSIKTLPSLSSMLLQIWLKSLFCDSIWETTFLEENNGSVNCATGLLCFFGGFVAWGVGGGIWEVGSEVVLPPLLSCSKTLSWF